MNDFLGLDPLEEEDTEELDKSLNEATTPSHNATIATATTKKASIPTAIVPVAVATPVTAAKTTVAVPRTKRKRPPNPVVKVHSDSDKERSNEEGKRPVAIA